MVKDTKILIPVAKEIFEILNRNLILKTFTNAGHELLSITLTDIRIDLWPTKDTRRRDMLDTEHTITPSGTPAFVPARDYCYTTLGGRKFIFEKKSDFTNLFLKIKKTILLLLATSPTSGEMKDASTVLGEHIEKNNGFRIKEMETKNIKTGQHCVWQRSNAKGAGIYEMMLHSVSGFTVHNGLTEKVAWIAAEGIYDEFNCCPLIKKKINAMWCSVRADDVKRQKTKKKAKAANKKRRKMS